MEQIIQDIKLLQERITYSKRLHVYLTKDTIKVLLKQQVELGICEDDKLDWNKDPISYFAGYPVHVELYNAVVLANANNGEILEKIRLSDKLI